MLLHEEVDHIVLEHSLDVDADTVTDVNVDAEKLKEINSIGEEIALSLNTNLEHNEFYPYSNDLTEEKLYAEIPVKLAQLLDALFPKSRTSTAQEKKDLRKVAVGHVIMQWCRKEGYQSPLLLAVGLFVHQITRSRVLIDVLCALGFSLSYSAVMNFEKCAAISTIEFGDIQSDEESLERFLQFIADNFDHNEDTTTGAGTTHVMGLISSEYPKSDTLALLPILKQNITSQKMTDSANLKGLIKT